MAEDTSFFVDKELMERLFGGGGKDKKEADPAPKPDSPKRPVEAQLSSVLVLERDGKTEEALVAATKIVDAAKTGNAKQDPDPLWVKGHLHFEKGQFAEAAEAYRQA